MPIAYLLSTEAGLPTTAPDPWTQAGGTVTIEARGYKVVDASAVDRALVWRPLEPDDASLLTPPSRGASNAEVQAQVVGSSYSGGASSIVLMLDDGARAVAVAIGDTLRFIDPYTLVELVEIATSWDWTGTHTYHLRKQGSAYWRVEVDGRPLGELGYASAPTSRGTPTATGWSGAAVAYGAWGAVSTARTSTAYFERIELALDQPLPPQWKVQQTRGSLLVAMQDAWTDLAEAVLRTTTALAEIPRRALEDAWLDQTAARHDAERYDFAGDLLPDAEDTPWTLVGAAGVSVVRERVRLTSTGAAKAGARIDFGGPVYSDAVEYATGATFTVRSTTPDGNGRVGPVVRCYDGTRVAVAQLLANPGNTLRAWILTNKVVEGPGLGLLGSPWYVDPSISHRVEVVMLSPLWVYLLVDDQIVDRIAYDSCDFGPP